jgi:cytochrome c556
MKLLLSGTIAISIALASTNVMAQQAKSLKQAERATHLRQSVFTLLGSNMGPLGAMAKGKIAFDAKRAEKHALRINQLSLMIADYALTDTSAHKVKTDALSKIWQQPADFAKRINALTLASANLQKAAASRDEKATKKAISGVGKTCGGCHDDFKAD